MNEKTEYTLSPDAKQLYYFKQNPDEKFYNWRLIEPLLEVTVTKESSEKAKKNEIYEFLKLLLEDALDLAREIYNLSNPDLKPDLNSDKYKHLNLDLINFLLNNSLNYLNNMNTVLQEPDNKYLHRLPFFQDYIDELGNHLVNNEVIGGKYTMPAIALSALTFPVVEEIAAGQFANVGISNFIEQLPYYFFKNGYLKPEVTKPLTSLGFGEMINEVGNNLTQYYTNGKYNNYPEYLDYYMFHNDFRHLLGEEGADLVLSSPGYILGDKLSNSTKIIGKGINKIGKSINSLSRTEKAMNGAESALSKANYDNSVAEATYNMAERDFKKNRGLLLKNESVKDNELKRNYRTFTGLPRILLLRFNNGPFNGFYRRNYGKNEKSMYNTMLSNQELFMLNHADETTLDFSNTAIPLKNKIDYVLKHHPKVLPKNIIDGYRNNVYTDNEIWRLINNSQLTGGSIDKSNRSIQQGIKIPLFDEGEGTGFKTGDYKIPIFGTDTWVLGTIEGTNPSKVLSISIDEILSNLKKDAYGKYIIDTNRNPSIVTLYLSRIPENYKSAIEHNINYVEQLFPGAKPFGSAALETGEHATPHKTHDIDFIITDTDLKRAESRYGSINDTSIWKQTRPETTYTINLDSKYGEAGNLDFNVIWTDPTTGYVDLYKGGNSNVGLELIRLYFPKEYKEAVQKSLLTGLKLLVAITPKLLMEVYDPKVKTMVDSFSSTKNKHMIRSVAHLTVSDPNIVELALDIYAKEKLGGEVYKLPISLDMFKNKSENEKIFDLLGYKGVDKNTVTSDPLKMMNLVNYWYYNNSIFSRGVNRNTIPLSVIDNYIRQGMSLEEAYMRASNDAFRYWNTTSIGGSANGAGLNTVRLGNSKHDSDLYGYILPYIDFKGKDALSLINEARRALGSYDYKFTDLENLLITQKLGTEFKGTVLDLLGRIPINLKGKKFLLWLRDDLGIYALGKAKIYGNSTYASLTGDIAGKDLVNFGLGRNMEIPASDIYKEILINKNALSEIDDLLLYYKNINNRGKQNKILGMILNNRESTMLLEVEDLKASLLAMTPERLKNFARKYPEKAGDYYKYQKLAYDLIPILKQYKKELLETRNVKNIKYSRYKKLLEMHNDIKRRLAYIKAGIISLSAAAVGIGTGTAMYNYYKPPVIKLGMDSKN